MRTPTAPRWPGRPLRRWLGSEQSFAALLVAPMLGVLLAFGAFPIIYSLAVSLFEWKLNIPKPAVFVGLANYARLFSDPVFTSGLLKTFYFTLLTVAGTVSLGLGIALLLDRDDIKGKGLVLALLIIPWAVPRVVGGLLWKWIYDGNYGILNAALLRLGLIDAYQWWFGQSPWLGLTLVGVAQIWRDTPFSVMLFLAGLQSVPVHLHRAAMMDGATGLQRFRFITLPSMRFVLLAVAVLQTTWALKTFDLVYVLTGGGPANKTMLTYLYVYRLAFSYLDVGYGSAMAYFVTMLVFVVAFGYYRMAGRMG